MTQQDNALNKEIRQLVVERLKEIPSNKKISIGGKGDFTMQELIKSVEKNDEVGQKVVEIQMKFLQSLKSGVLLDE